MASSVTLAFFGVLCLILIQNQVYSKPAAQNEEGKDDKVAPPDQPQDQPQRPETAAQTQPQPQSQTPPQTDGKAQPQPQPQPQPQSGTQPPVTTLKEPTKDVSTPAAAVTAATAKPSAQAAGEKKDGAGKDGSAVIVANYALLLLGACLITRL